MLSGSLTQPVNRPPHLSSPHQPALALELAREIEQNDAGKNRQQALPRQYEHHDTGEHEDDAKQVLDRGNEESNRRWKPLEVKTLAPGLIIDEIVFRQFREDSCTNRCHDDDRQDRKESQPKKYVRVVLKHLTRYHLCFCLEFDKHRSMIRQVDR